MATKKTINHNRRTHPENWNDVLEHNKGYVECTAHRLCAKHGLEHFDDLYQEGLIGLWMGYERWDRVRPFLTYAGWWILSRQMEWLNNKNLVWIPDSARRKPGEKSIQFEYVSLGHTLGDDEEATLENTLAEPLADDPAELAARADDIKKVRAALDMLPLEYQDALRWRYGEDAKLDKIADRLGKSRSFVVVAEKKFKKKYKL